MAAPEPIRYPSRTRVTQTAVNRFTMPSADELLESALAYADAGFRVFPCVHGTKVPLAGSNGHLEATTDQKKIRRWWRTTPMANVAIATGDLFDVIDLDVRQVGTLSLFGLDSLRRTASSRQDDLSWLLDPVTDAAVGRSVATPRGGRHLYVATGDTERYPDGKHRRTGRSGVLTHVDFRSTGNYVLAPPSWYDPAKNYKDESGLPAARYVVENASDYLPVLPDWLHQIVATKDYDAPLGRILSGTVGSFPDRRGVSSTGKPKRYCCKYVDNAFTGAMAEVSATLVGSRNHDLNVQAFKMAGFVVGGYLSADRYRDGLLQAVAAAPDPLPLKEATAVIDRALKDAEVRGAVRHCPSHSD